MDNIETCPNCKEPLKGGWSSNKKIPQKDVNFINLMLGRSDSFYCNKCSNNLIIQAESKYKSESSILIDFIQNNINKIPILSTHTPYNWQYESISIVTAQSVTGTGFISEFKSSFTDFFGAQSGSFNKKISDGEQLCFAQSGAKPYPLVQMQ